MIVIVCGSRSIGSYDTVAHAIERTGWEPWMIVHGDAKGVDTKADEWADENDVCKAVFPYGAFVHDGDERYAGNKRNRTMATFLEMIEQGHAGPFASHDVGVVAVWDGESSGTEDMIRVARRYGFKVSVYEPFKDEKQEELL